jgi:hypothetical protein
MPVPLWARLHFVCAADPLSRLIAWYGRGAQGLSHVDIELPDGTLVGARSNVINGIPAGFQRRPANYAKWIRVSTVTLPLTELQAMRAYRWVRNTVGAKYDTAAILGFVEGSALHKRGEYICSAAGTEFLRQAGKLPTLPIAASQVTPDTLQMMAIAAGGKWENVK